ncbi:MAG: response regulator transcription factor [Jatrophihabitans sp.]|uniref:response regulator transcription factor n=1 Tax=Jatrophihabitans sp. TaxID=1932789 RepID=UPI003F7D22DA
MSAVRVLLADDHGLIREGFRMILDAQDDVEVVGEAADGAQAVDAVRALRPDVVVMDVRMPGTDGIEATRRICAERPETRVLILTTFDLDEYAFAGLRAGASGFLLKNVPPAELIAAIHTVAAGDAIVSPRVTRRLLDTLTDELPAAANAEAEARLATLTDRERDVLEAIASGMTNTEIAQYLRVGDATVKSHVSRVLAKLGLRDRVQAVIFAYDCRLARPAS